MVRRRVIVCDADTILVAFQKNVYSVFRYNPPAVGFAQLSSAALAMNGVNGNPPSATIGSVSASATAGGGGINGAGGRWYIPRRVVSAVAAVIGAVLL